jgi:hypothetical protein
VPFAARVADGDEPVTVLLPGPIQSPADVVQYWNERPLTAVPELTLNEKVFPVLLPLAPLFGTAYVELPEPSVKDQPGDELESVKLRSVSGFNASANTDTDGKTVAATMAITAASGVPRRTIDLSVYIFCISPIFVLYFNPFTGVCAHCTISGIMYAMSYPQHFSHSHDFVFLRCDTHHLFTAIL